MKIVCERCQAVKEHEDRETLLAEMHSMIIVLQRVTTAGYAFHQCNSGGLVDGHGFQHWSCNHEEMRQGAIQCIQEHYPESSMKAVPVEQVKLHETVLRAGLTCKVCASPLRYIAYRFCLTHATPVNFVPDESHNELREWCCSLAHAQQSAIAIINIQ